MSNKNEIFEQLNDNDEENQFLGILKIKQHLIDNEFINFLKKFILSKKNNLIKYAFLQQVSNFGCKKKFVLKTIQKKKIKINLRKIKTFNEWKYKKIIIKILKQLQIPKSLEQVILFFTKKYFEYYFLEKQYLKIKQNHIKSLLFAIFILSKEKTAFSFSINKIKKKIFRQDNYPKKKIYSFQLLLKKIKI